MTARDHYFPIVRARIARTLTISTVSSIREMRQGAPTIERGHGAQRSPAVTLDVSVALKTSLKQAGPPGPASLRLGLPLMVLSNWYPSHGRPSAADPQ